MKIVLLGSATLLALGAAPASAQFRAALDVADATVDEGCAQPAAHRRSRRGGLGAARRVPRAGQTARADGALQRLPGTPSREPARGHPELRARPAERRGREARRHASHGGDDRAAGAAGRGRRALPARGARAALAAPAQRHVGQLAERGARYGFILEAYQIEAEYGRTVSAYDGTVNVDGEELAVEFLRIGCASR